MTDIQTAERSADAMLALLAALLVQDAVQTQTNNAEEVKNESDRIRQRRSTHPAIGSAR